MDQSTELLDPPEPELNDLVIPPVDVNTDIPNGATCQEASPLSRGRYVPCGAAAVAMVSHEKDGRAYLMCAPCADHNVRNRGGKLLKSTLAAMVVPELVTDPATLINIDRVLHLSEGVTAQDVAEAVVLEHRALAIAAIEDDAIEEHVGDLLDQLTAVDSRIEAKGRRWVDLAFKLHRSLTGLFGANGQARQHTQNGLRHLRPLLAHRLEAKRHAEEQRQREARETALREEQERKLQEATHLEATGASPEEVQQVLLEAETLPPPPVAAQPITNIRGASVRENWKCECTNKHELVKFVAANPSFINLLDWNQTASNQLAKAQKSGLRIPGLRAYNDVVLTKRRT